MIGALLKSIALLVCVVATTAPALAQTPPATARVGWISYAPRPAAPADVQKFREGMRERGWTEGRNFVLDVRSGGRERAQDLATELIAANVDVIVAQGPMIFGARSASRTVPVLFVFSGDPVEAGVVTSLSRPGGNVTGVALLSHELAAKRIELLKEALPNLARIAIVANVAHPGEQSELRTTQAVAQRLGLQATYLPVRSPTDFDAAFEAIQRERADAIVAFPDVLIMSQAERIAQFALANRTPAISGWSEFAAAGNLMSFGPSSNVWGQIARQADRILRGAKPADMPVEQPTDFELVINARTAKALGVNIPRSLLVQARTLLE